MEELPQLSKREKEVVTLLREGKSNKMIASALGISERTVEFHLNNVYNKLQVSSRVELVLKLGESTVVEEGQDPKNRDDSRLKQGVTSLREAVSKIGKDLKLTTPLPTDTINESNTITFFEAIRICFIQYAEFQGRASRPEFWWFALFVLLVDTALAYISEPLAAVFLVAVLLPLLAVGARRLNDVGKNGWWLFYLLLPVGGLIILGYYWALPPAEKKPDESTVIS
jgi:DNA-binding CsgD family transcriptional regulator